MSKMKYNNDIYGMYEEQYNKNLELSKENKNLKLEIANAKYELEYLKNLLKIKLKMQFKKQQNH